MNKILTEIQNEWMRFVESTPRELLLAGAAVVLILLITLALVWFVRRNRSRGPDRDREEILQDKDSVVLDDAGLDGTDLETAVVEDKGPEEAAAKTADEAEEAQGAEIEEVRAEEAEEIEAEAEPVIDAEPAADVREPGPPVPRDRGHFLSRLKQGLKKTRNAFSSGLENVFSGNRKIDDALLEDIEELLITSDLGVQAAMDLVEKISKRPSDVSSLSDFQTALRKEMLSSIEAAQSALDRKKTDGLNIVMVVGVNGVGKTTTIGKLAARFAQEGKKVLVVAADTFRAAAIEQLTIWAERAGADLVKHKHGSDPAAVAYDGMEAAVARGVDVVLIDTAGRLHTKVNLMEELKKIKRTITKKIPEAPHEILLTLDATTGQNALAQAELFHEALGVTGIALTKLDGTAKGGIVIGICNTLNIPLQYIGVGEQTDDLQDFDAKQFVDALF